MISNRLKFSFGLTVLAGVCALWYGVATRGQETVLHLAHTNDLHAHLIPWHAKNADCVAAEPACRGGFARIKTLIDAQKKAHPDTLVLDAGDRFSGTVFYTFRKSQDIAAAIQEMGYDALTLGNHEFDDGLPELGRFLAQVDAPVVAANIDFSETVLKDDITPYTVVRRNGVSIGIIGAVTDAVKTETNGFEDIPVQTAAESVCAVADTLKQQGVSILIALTHIGIEADKELAQACPDIDVIVGAHSHTLLSNDAAEKGAAPYPVFITHPNGDKTAIVTAGLGGHHVGLLMATFDSNGHLKTAKGNTVPVTTDITPDTAIDTQVGQAQTALTDLLTTPLATAQTAFPLTPEQNYCSESCAVGNALADLVLSADPKADFALLNSGGIRAALPAGTITIAHMAQAYPFDSKLVTVPMTGREITDVIQAGVSRYLPNDRTNTLAIVAGLSYTFDGTTRTVTDIRTAAGKPLQPDTTYAVAVPAFLAKGGDGFPRKEPLRVISSSVRETLVQQIQKHAPTRIDTRIQKQ